MFEEAHRRIKDIMFAGCLGFVPLFKFFYLSLEASSLILSKNCLTNLPLFHQVAHLVKLK